MNNSPSLQEETMEALLAEFGGAVQPKRGALLDATISRRDSRNGSWWIDFGGKTDAILPEHEVGDANLEVGQKTTVLVLDAPASGDIVTVSLIRALPWQKLHSLRASGETTCVHVTRVVRNRSGGIVGVQARTLGMEGFVPFKLLGVKPNQADALINQPLDVKVIEVDPTIQRLIFDAGTLRREKDRGERRRAVNEAREKRFSELQVGMTLEGTVAKIVPYGYFVEIGGDTGCDLHGLLHNNNHSGTALSEGEKVSARVLRLGHDKDGKPLVGLETGASAHLLREAARDKCFEQISEGAVLTGTVARVVDFGVFIDVGGEEGGHLHALLPKNLHNGCLLGKGDQVLGEVVRRTRGDDGERLVTLTTIPFFTYVKEGDVFEAPVRGKTDFGAFFRLSSRERIDGMVHKSKLPQGEAQLEALEMNARHTVRIDKLDRNTRRIELSVVSIPEVAA